MGEDFGRKEDSIVKVRMSVRPSQLQVTDTKALVAVIQIVLLFETTCEYASHLEHDA